MAQQCPSCGSGEMPTKASISTHNQLGRGVSVRKIAGNTSGDMVLLFAHYNKYTPVLRAWMYDH